MSRIRTQLVFVVKSSVQSIKNPGLRGGKFWIDDSGNVRYGQRPYEKSPLKPEDVKNLNKNQLRQMARHRGLKGYPWAGDGTLRDAVMTHDPNHYKVPDAPNAVLARRRMKAYNEEKNKGKGRQKIWDAGKKAYWDEKKDNEAKLQNKKLLARNEERAEQAKKMAQIVEEDLKNVKPVTKPAAEPKIDSGTGKPMDSRGKIIPTNLRSEYRGYKDRVANAQQAVHEYAERAKVHDKNYREKVVRYQDMKEGYEDAQKNVKVKEGERNVQAAVLQKKQSEMMGAGALYRMKKRALLAAKENPEKAKRIEEGKARRLKAPDGKSWTRSDFHHEVQQFGNWSEVPAQDDYTIFSHFTDSEWKDYSHPSNFRAAPYPPHNQGIELKPTVLMQHKDGSYWTFRLGDRKDHHSKSEEAASKLAFAIGQENAVPARRMIATKVDNIKQQVLEANIHAGYKNQFKGKTIVGTLTPAIPGRYMSVRSMIHDDSMVISDEVAADYFVDDVVGMAVGRNKSIENGTGVYLTNEGGIVNRLNGSAFQRPGSRHRTMFGRKNNGNGYYDKTLGAKVYLHVNEQLTKTGASEQGKITPDQEVALQPLVRALVVAEKFQALPEDEHNLIVGDLIAKRGPYGADFNKNAAKEGKDKTIESAVFALKYTYGEEAAKKAQILAFGGEVGKSIVFKSSFKGKVVNPGLRGGKFYIDNQGNVRYGDRPGTGGKQITGAHELNAKQLRQLAQLRGLKGYQWAGAGTIREGVDATGSPESAAYAQRRMEYYLREKAKKKGLAAMEAEGVAARKDGVVPAKKIVIAVKAPNPKTKPPEPKAKTEPPKKKGDTVIDTAGDKVPTELKSEYQAYQKEKDKFAGTVERNQKKLEEIDSELKGLHAARNVAHEGMPELQEEYRKERELRDELLQLADSPDKIVNNERDAWIRKLEDEKLRIFIAKVAKEGGGVANIEKKRTERWDAAKARRVTPPHGGKWSNQEFNTPPEEFAKWKKVPGKNPEGLYGMSEDEWGEYASPENFRFIEQQPDQRGVSRKMLMQHKDGTYWMYKAGYQVAGVPEVEEAAANIYSKIGLEVHAPVRKIDVSKVDGFIDADKRAEVAAKQYLKNFDKHKRDMFGNVRDTHIGSIQPFVEHLGKNLDDRGSDHVWGTEQLANALEDGLANYLIGNRDAHAEQYVVAADKLYSLDKGFGFRGKLGFPVGEAMYPAERQIKKNLAAAPKIKAGVEFKDLTPAQVNAVLPISRLLYAARKTSEVDDQWYEGEIKKAHDGLMNVPHVDYAEKIKGEAATVRAALMIAKREIEDTVKNYANSEWGADVVRVAFMVMESGVIAKSMSYSVQILKGAMING